LNHSLLDRSVREFLDVLGSDAPAPGGGAAAALAGAMGAALVSMTANLTLGRRRFAEVEEQARAIQAEAERLRRLLEQYADADAAAFERVSAAYRRPRATEAERAERSSAIQAALGAAAQVPLEVARTCGRLLELCQSAAPVLNPSVISDVLVGAELAHAALESAALNVEVNLAAMTDPAARDPLAAQLASARAGASDVLGRVLASGRQHIASG
jgi:methenyltetrahydrofolate cyclohydrolase